MAQDTIQKEVTKQAIAAAMAARAMVNVSTEVKNNILKAMADALQKNKEELLFLNQADLKDTVRLCNCIMHYQDLFLVIV